MHIWNLCWAWPTVILRITNSGYFSANFYGLKFNFRYTFRFKWSDSLVQDGPPSVIQDAQFEIASVLMETAIWLIKYGARIAGKEDITEADAKIEKPVLERIAPGLKYKDMRTWVFYLSVYGRLFKAVVEKILHEKSTAYLTCSNAKKKALMEKCKWRGRLYMQGMFW